MANEETKAICARVLADAGLSQTQIHELGYGHWKEYELGTYPEEDRWDMNRYEDHEDGR